MTGSGNTGPLQNELPGGNKPVHDDSLLVLDSSTKGNVGNAKNTAEARVQCIAEISQALIKAYNERGTVNIVKLKQAMSSKYSLANMPKLIEIIAAIPEGYRDKLTPYLRAKPVRSSAGVAVVAVMTRPWRCPHLTYAKGVCIYCPGGPDSGMSFLWKAMLVS